MRALRFGTALALAILVALGGCTAHPSSGGLALDRQLGHALTDMIASAEVGPDGKIFYNRMPDDRRFLEPNSGRYWQVSGKGQGDFRSRSLWYRTLEVSRREATTEPFFYDSDQFPDEPLRMAERTVRLPGSDVEWRFVMATARDEAAN